MLNLKYQVLRLATVLSILVQLDGVMAGSNQGIIFDAYHSYGSTYTFIVCTIQLSRMKVYLLIGKGRQVGVHRFWI